MNILGSTTRRVVQNSLLNFIAGVSQRVGQAFIFILIARLLTDRDTGAFNLANSYTSVLLAFSLWGLDQLLIREIAKSRDAISDYLGRYLTLRALLAGLLWIGLALLLRFLPYQAETKRLILIMSLSMIPASIMNLYQAVWIGLEEVRAISAIMLGGSILRIVGGSLLLYRLGTIIEIGYLFLVVSLAEMVVTIWLTHLQAIWTPLQWKIDLQFWIENLRTATPLIVVSLVLIIEYQFDVLILSLFRPEAEVGIYGKAVTLLTFFLFLTRSYQLAIFPVLARAFKESEAYLQRIYSRSLTFLLAGAFGVSVVVIVLAEPIVQLVYGPNTEETATILRVLIVVFVISAFNVPNSRLLVAANEQRVMAYFAIASTGGNLLLSLWLVPRFGGMGTATARVLAMPLYSIPAFLYINRHICRFSWRAAHRRTKSQLGPP